MKQAQEETEHAIVFLASTMEVNSPLLVSTMADNLVWEHQAH